MSLLYMCIRIFSGRCPWDGVFHQTAGAILAPIGHPNDLCASLFLCHDWWCFTVGDKRSANDKHVCVFQQIVHVSNVADRNFSLRMYPGCELSKNYDLTQQAWYMKTRASYPTLTFTGPHESEFTGQRVVTISRALQAGSGWERKFRYMYS